MIIFYINVFKSGDSNYEKLISLLFIFSSINASANAGLNEAIVEVKNSINMSELAKSVICGEQLSKDFCKLSRAIGGLMYAGEIRILKRALITEGLFSEEEILRIQNALTRLEENNDKF